ncbi:uncharacterized protein BDR25DRAFT_320541 [Lindgomyces ingoldianus]|uniref:Uncharacterized protein n=1 Tax=Lindgomyces ingoldianus TaxID=673940 RepID=A0ACB6Q7B8_9PLEO|nr:uncharacterized protein BDR25DRAFT_320541 [Lindgomyces ingoldianus]KAF2462716.1 hypothetical protein BDR25DRAFT_320541 [Lindgomyces ingoldianus]
MFEPIVDPAARDRSTKFPLDGLAFDISSMPQKTLIAHGKAAPVLHSLGGVQIVRLSRSLILKSGTGVLASEGETMRYVMTACPEVRLPKVHRYFNVDSPSSYFGVEGYIVMDYVEGRSLDSCWDQLNQEAQKDLVTQVAAMVNQLQSIHSDSPGVIHGGISRGMWFSDYGAGPFPTKAVFEKWVNWKLALSKHLKQAAVEVPEISYRHFVLTHGDLSPRNLILDADNQLWLIDWGCAGFYPPIFEAATLKHQVQFRSFTQPLLPLIYNNTDEMAQLESCSYGINRVVFSLPPEMAEAGVTDYYRRKTVENQEICSKKQ